MFRNACCKKTLPLTPLKPETITYQIKDLLHLEGKVRIALKERQRKHIQIITPWVATITIPLQRKTSALLSSPLTPPQGTPT